VPGRVGAVSVVSADKKKTSTPALPTVTGEAGQVHTDCHTAFGFQGTTAGRETEELLVRWAVAARLAPEAMRAQMEAAVHRFNRLERHATQSIRLQTKHAKDVADQVWVTRTRWEWLFSDTEVPVSFRDLFSAPAHAAAAVDCYINTPSAALGAARRAYERAARDWKAANPGMPLELSDDGFRLLFLMAYLSERWYYTGSEPPRAMSAYGERTEIWKLFSARRGTNNVAADRIARLLARINEAVPPPAGAPADLEPRSLGSRTRFHWT
jgi:hypothetical protein